MTNHNAELPQVIYLPVVKDSEGVIVGYGAPAADKYLAELYMAGMEMDHTPVGGSVYLLEYTLD